MFERRHFNAGKWVQNGDNNATKGQHQQETATTPRPQGGGGGPEAQGLETEPEGRPVGAGAMGEWQLLSERLPVIDRGREIVQPATSSSHCLNPTTGATGTRSLQGSPLFSLYSEEQRKGRQGMDPGTGPAQQSKPPVPGIAPGAGDTFVKRINRARDGFRAHPQPHPGRQLIS